MMPSEMRFSAMRFSVLVLVSVVQGNDAENSHEKASVQYLKGE